MGACESFPLLIGIIIDLISCRSCAGTGYPFGNNTDKLTGKVIWGGRHLGKGYWLQLATGCVFLTKLLENSGQGSEAFWYILYAEIWIIVLGFAARILGIMGHDQSKGRLRGQWCRRFSSLFRFTWEICQLMMRPISFDFQATKLHSSLHQLPCTCSESFNNPNTFLSDKRGALLTQTLVFDWSSGCSCSVEGNWVLVPSSIAPDPSRRKAWCAANKRDWVWILRKSRSEGNANHQIFLLLWSSLRYPVRKTNTSMSGEDICGCL